MKATIEFDHSELITAISSGALLALANAVGEAKGTQENEMQAAKAPVQAPKVPEGFTPVTPQDQIPFMQAPPYQAPQQQNMAPQQQSMAPQQQNMAPQQQMPQQPIVPVQQAPVYTFEQLSVAATPLIDNGRIGELQGLMQRFGVQALTQLPKERYGEFATALRGLGAKI